MALPALTLLSTWGLSNPQLPSSVQLHTTTSAAAHHPHRRTLNTYSNLNPPRPPKTKFGGIPTPRGSDFSLPEVPAREIVPPGATTGRPGPALATRVLH
jgi:hypothetical protein